MKSESNKVSKSDMGSNQVGREAVRKTWQPMKLTYAGEAKDIVRGGGGKTGITQADIGDTNKPKGQN